MWPIDFLLHTNCRPHNSSRMALRVALVPQLRNVKGNFDVVSQYHDPPEHASSTDVLLNTRHSLLQLNMLCGSAATGDKSRLQGRLTSVNSHESCQFISSFLVRIYDSLARRRAAEMRGQATWLHSLESGPSAVCITSHASAWCWRRTHGKDPDGIGAISGSMADEPAEVTVTLRWRWSQRSGDGGHMRRKKQGWMNRDGTIALRDFRILAQAKPPQ